MLFSQPVSGKPEGDGAQIPDSYTANSNMGITKLERSGLAGVGRDESSQKNKKMSENIFVLLGRMSHHFWDDGHLQSLGCSHEGQV